MRSKWEEEISKTGFYTIISVPSYVNGRWSLKAHDSSGNVEGEEEEDSGRGPGPYRNVLAARITLPPKDDEEMLWKLETEIRESQIETAWGMKMVILKTDKEF